MGCHTWHLQHICSHPCLCGWNYVLHLNGYLLHLKNCLTLLKYVCHFYCYWFMITFLSAHVSIYHHKSCNKNGHMVGLLILMSTILFEHGINPITFLHNILHKLTTTISFQCNKICNTLCIQRIGNIDSSQKYLS